MKEAIADTQPETSSQPIFSQGQQNDIIISPTSQGEGFISNPKLNEAWNEFDIIINPQTQGKETGAQTKTSSHQPNAPSTLEGIGQVTG